MKEVQFKLTFKQGTKVVGEVTGRKLDADMVKVGDVLELEAVVERVTGLRCHAEMTSESK